jgi:hypothetical protein
MTNIDAIWQDLVWLTMLMCYKLPNCEKNCFYVEFFLAIKVLIEGDLDP